MAKIYKTVLKLLTTINAIEGSYECQHQSILFNVLKLEDWLQIKLMRLMFSVWTTIKMGHNILGQYKVQMRVLRVTQDRYAWFCERRS